MDKPKTPSKQPSSQDFYEAAYKLLANPYIDPAVKFLAALTKPPGNQEDKHINKFFRFCVATFPGCLSLKLIKVYSSKEPPVTNEIRESAIRFLYVIISIEEAYLDLEVVRQLSPILITCLEEQAIPETSFKILSKLVNRIAYERFTVHEATWHDLREFISSRADTDFAKSAFVFKSLTMPLDGEEFVIPLMENLLPAILKRLSEESSSQWGLAFVSGFCVVVHLLETTRVDLVKNLVYEMLRSVKRGMELGFLWKALREVETVVVKQLGWYCTTEFRFVLGLIRKINEINGEERTKNVLQRIKMVVEKKMIQSVEEIDIGDDEDWLNQRH